MLVCLQTLPQLKSHTAAALNVGVEPIQIREAVYQLAPFIGFPRTLNAVATINEVFRGQASSCPLPPKARCRTPTGLKGSRSRHRWRGRDQGNLDLPELTRPCPRVRLGDSHPDSPCQREPGAVSLADRRAPRPSSNPRPRLPPGGQLDRRRRSMGPLPPHRIPARCRCHPCGQEPLQQRTTALACQSADDEAGNQPTADCAGQPEGATYRSCPAKPT